MKWSWRVLTVAGIGVYIHVTFLLLLIWAGWYGYSPRQSWWDAAGQIGFVLALFGIVVLHELGHALTARRFGIGTKDITLLPIGGVARLERMPEDPKQELLVALAGPAVNVILAALLFVGLAVAGQFSDPEWMLHSSGNFFVRLMAVNVLLAVFNMLPAFPMDGGRVLRALLAFRLSYARATRIAARIGQGMAVLFGFAGLLGPNPFLVLIAAFVWIAAGQEASQVQMKSALNGIRVDEVMITEFRTLNPEDTLTRAVEFLLAGYQADFPVLDDGRVVGLLSRRALVDGLARLGRDMPVADAMRKDFPTVTPDELAETVLVRLQQHLSDYSLPVIEDGRLLGILTRENLGEYLMVQSALENEPNARPIGLHVSERHAT